MSVAGAKRTAHDRVEGEPRKRKRVDHSATFHQAQQALPTSAAASANAGAKQSGNAVGGNKPDGDSPPSLVSGLSPYALPILLSHELTSTFLTLINYEFVPVMSSHEQFDFSTLPTASLYRYIIHHDLIPHIYPTPLSADDPPPPAALLDPLKMASRAPSPQPLMGLGTTPANRPQRRSRASKEASQRRSTRILEEETRVGPEQVPVLADVGEIHNVLANIAQRHFRESTVKELDTLSSFMCAVKAKGGRWR